MSTLKRAIIEIPIGELKNIDQMFERQAEVNLETMPKKYANLVEKTREVAFSNFKVMGVFASVKLLECRENENEVLLEQEMKIYSKMMPVLFKKSEEVVFYATSVLGYLEEEKKEKRFMEQFFLDAWGTSFAEVASSWLKKYISDLVAKTGWHSTSSWNPGQHGFSIENQKPVFQVLKPDEIGLTLNERCIMHPSKSVSGVFGIGKEKDERRIVPCDYCDLRETCPSAYQSELS